MLGLTQLAQRDRHLIEIGKLWVVDYRIYDPDRDGKTKIEHVIEMLQNLVYHKSLPFKTVLMDSWYATNKLMLYIDDLGKYYYCPLKRNRLVDDTGDQEDYKRIELLSWDEKELKLGKTVKIKKFPGAKKYVGSEFFSPILFLTL